MALIPAALHQPNPARLLHRFCQTQTLLSTLLGELRRLPEQGESLSTPRRLVHPQMVSIYGAIEYQTLSFQLPTVGLLKTPAPIPDHAVKTIVFQCPWAK
jgi:hypothetical protein